MTTAKSILKSKTFWIAMIQAFIGVITAIATEFPTLGSLLIAKSFLDILLRVYTEKPII